MRRYVGPKPCAGCGTPGTQQWRPGADAICEHCVEFIKLGRGVVRVDEKGFTKVRLMAHESAFDYPRFGTYGNSYSHGQQLPALPYLSNYDGREDGSLDQLEKTFGKLLVSLNVGVKNSYEYLLYFPGLGIDAEMAFPSSVAKQFAEFYKTLCVYAKRLDQEAYERGKNEGESLLIKLATGEISISDFNEATVRNG